MGSSSRLTVSSQAAHSYNKSTEHKSKVRPTRIASSRSSKKKTVSESKSDSDFSAQEPCHSCKKNITMENDGV